MITRRFVLAGLVAAPAVIRPENLMRVHSLPQRYATVWGVGHDLEVIEHVVWDNKGALAFAQPNGPLERFREVTDIVYGFDMPLLPRNNGYDRPFVADPFYSKDQGPIIKENGFTKIMSFSEMRSWQEAQRPDLNGRLSAEWVQEQIAKEKASVA